MFAYAAFLPLGVAAAPGAPVHVAAAPDAATLRLADDRLVAIDGLLPPTGADDGAKDDADGAAAAAHAAVIRAIVGETVTLTPLLNGADRWGRIPADVFRVRDGAWLQELLLTAGHGRIEACPRGDAERLGRLRLTEASARRGRVGLWALPIYQIRRADRSMRPEGFALVEGLALATGGGREMRYLNFAEDWRKDFTLAADRGSARRLERLELDFAGLVGQKVLARGWLRYRNGPMITIECPQQIEVRAP